MPVRFQLGDNRVKVEPDVAGEQITIDAGQHTQKNLQRKSNKNLHRPNKSYQHGCLQDQLLKVHYTFLHH